MTNARIVLSRVKSFGIVLSKYCRFWFSTTRILSTVPSKDIQYPKIRNDFRTFSAKIWYISVYLNRLSLTHDYGTDLKGEFIHFYTVSDRHCWSSIKFRVIMKKRLFFCLHIVYWSDIKLGDSSNDCYVVA